MLAIDVLLSSDPQFRKPTTQEKKDILKRLNLSANFTRAFDLIKLPQVPGAAILNISVGEIILIELKTTRKKLVNNPSGFFFGATENEFKLANLLRNQYYFCFLSLHPESTKYVMLTSEELSSKIRTKRVQYQINLF